MSLSRRPSVGEACAHPLCPPRRGVVSKTASEYLVEAMEKAGVKRVYGVIGDALNGFSDALDRLDPHAASVSR
jgi:hypothetical protein